MLSQNLSQILVGHLPQGLTLQSSQGGGASINLEAIIKQVCIAIILQVLILIMNDLWFLYRSERFLEQLLMKLRKKERRLASKLVTLADNHQNLVCLGSPRKGPWVLRVMKR